MLNEILVTLYEVMVGITDLEVCGLCTEMHSCQYWLRRVLPGVKELTLYGKVPLLTPKY